MKEISLRTAVPEDWDAIQKWHVEQQHQQGSNFELPYLFGQRQIPIVLVAEDESGTIRGALYVELVGELRFVGCDPKVTAVGWRAADGLCFLLKQMGIRYLETFVPKKLKRFISKPLKRAGFTDMDQELSYFSRDLRGK